MDRPNTITGILLACFDLSSVLGGMVKMTLAGTHYMAGQRMTVNGVPHIILGIKTTVDSRSGVLESELTLLRDDDPE